MEGKLHLITSNDRVPNNIINYMAFSTSNIDTFIKHLKKIESHFGRMKEKIVVRKKNKDRIRQVKFLDSKDH